MIEASPLAIANMLAAAVGALLLLFGAAALATRRRDEGLDIVSFLESNLYMLSASAAASCASLALQEWKGVDAPITIFFAHTGAFFMLWVAVGGARRDASPLRSPLLFLAALIVSLAFLSLAIWSPSANGCGFRSFAFGALGVAYYGTHRNPALLLAAALYALDIQAQTGILSQENPTLHQLVFCLGAHLQVFLYGGVLLMSGQPPASFLQQSAWGAAGEVWTKYTLIGVMASIVLIALSPIFTSQPEQAVDVKLWAGGSCVALLMAILGAAWSQGRHFHSFLRPTDNKD